jgi:hypothetical protein
MFRYMLYRLRYIVETLQIQEPVIRLGGTNPWGGAAVGKKI